MSESSKNNNSLVDTEKLMSNNFQHVTTRLIMSGDLNAAHTLFGGKLIQWVDEAASTYVMGLLRSHHIVTKKISEVLYNEPTRLGDVLDFLFRVKKVGITSIAVECVVHSKVIDHDDTLRLILNCELVFVKIDKLGRPVAHNFKI